MSVNKLKSDYIHEKIQAINHHIDGSNNADLILVAKYGQKEKVIAWCKKNDVDPIHIWEF
ncbi:hypothetical protein [Fodinibius salsisoli]|uniref:Uncharacterized protein n=1 Tax=Fodinibius salsisoli TaxID=2820877 RepID=A0ABT3PIT0_9BACT|nr:hypothetical protein [Fodinibius salsisoli]MCW9705844.1 hypothetical protein [Fodinibius salsisoli]